MRKNILVTYARRMAGFQLLLWVVLIAVHTKLTLVPLLVGMHPAYAPGTDLTHGDFVVRTLIWGIATITSTGFTLLLTAAGESGLAPTKFDNVFEEGPISSAVMDVAVVPAIWLVVFAAFSAAVAAYMIPTMGVTQLPADVYLIVCSAINIAFSVPLFLWSWRSCHALYRAILSVELKDR